MSANLFADTDTQMNLLLRVFRWFLCCGHMAPKQALLTGLRSFPVLPPLVLVVAAAPARGGENVDSPPRCILLRRNNS